MSQTTAIDAPRLRLLHELFTSATHDASAAMCRWTNGLITLTLDEIRELPLEEVCSALDVGDEMLTMVVLSIPGEVGGEMLLTFDEHNGRQLAATLLRRQPDESEQWTELEQSALTETGNILACAHVNALTRLLGVELIPTPPYFIQDYAASVVEQAVMAQALLCDQVLVCRTIFQRAGQELNWNVFFLPTPALRERMQRMSAAQA